MAKNLKVYLDHHIKRENLLYRRAVSEGDEQTNPEQYLKIEYLTEAEHSRAHLLRKPDFQRATSAWSPEDCVDLLQSVLTEQVVPSVILWLDPESNWYVLDGGHRISVLLAWIRDDWGDRRPSQEYRDDMLEMNSQLAGQKVRELLRQRGIGSFVEYRDADRKYRELTRSNRIPEQEMGWDEITYARLVRRWQSVSMGFPILWVKGDYEKAEESFLKINKSGRQLSVWETTLVEHRRSSFARAVMSIANITDREHCWPISDPDVLHNKTTQASIQNILQATLELHRLLFTPTYETPLTRPIQPLLATPFTRPELKPAYLAEVLTITEGHKGQKPETRKLLQRDALQPVPVMVATGEKLLRNALDVIKNISGPSPRSLNLMPIVSFYNDQGTYVRSLMYGMLYWINAGSPEDVLRRKRFFAAHRGSFEQVLLANKDRIIKRIGRRIGSGPEVTYQTALYFDGLLRIIIKNSGAVETENFAQEHNYLIETLSVDAQDAADESLSNHRTFRGLTRAAVVVPNLVNMLPKCAICAGRFHPNHATQIDHIVPYAQGGPTTPQNGREGHPFCNNQRAHIEEISTLEPEQALKLLPAFEYPRRLPKAQQLSFLSFVDGYEQGDELDVEALEESDEDEIDVDDTLPEL